MLIAKQQALEDTYATETGPAKWFFLITYSLIRLSLGGIFLWSGIAKLLVLERFSIIIESYGLIPDSWVPAVALCLSAVEVLAGLGLIIDLHWSLGLVTALLVFFMILLSYGLWMGLDVDCGCFGPEDPEAKAYQGLRPAFYRDLIMLAAALGLFFGRQQKSMSLKKIWGLNNQKIKRR